MNGLTGDRARFGLIDLALFLVGVAGLAMCLTLVFLAMRAVMDVGGYCAEGGPYVIETHCPEGVPLVLIGGVFGLFGFGGLTAWKGAQIGSFYGALVLLAWPALFISLGWNFLEYAFWPPGGGGIVWGWLIPGVIFELMGGLPLLAVLPFGRPGRSAKALSWMVGGPTSRSAKHSTWRVTMPGNVFDSDMNATPHNLLSTLERLADLHRSGDLTDHEYERAKQAVLDAAESA